MIKYEVYKEAIGALKGDADWSVEDMELFMRCCRTSYNPTLIKQFSENEKGQAIALFNKEKEQCVSRYIDGTIGALLLFDCVHIEENVYDDDGEYQSCNGIIDSYISKIKK